MGCCFLAGGIHNTRTGTAAGIEQDFNSTVASTMSSLMAVASASLIIPATVRPFPSCVTYEANTIKLYAALQNSDADSKANILILSHGTAIILLILYVLYLIFQLRTHAVLFDAETAPEDSSNESEEPLISPWAAAGVLILVTIAVAVCAEFLVDSIDSLVATAHISKTFVGLILLPIVGNAAEHVTAVVVAVKDKMDLAMGVAIGSSMQIALLVTPFLVILGWIIDQPMTLHFEIFETVVFFLSILVVAYVIQDGKSNYLEGAMVRPLLEQIRGFRSANKGTVARPLHHHRHRLPRLPRRRFRSRDVGRSQIVEGTCGILIISMLTIPLLWLGTKALWRTNEKESGVWDPRPI